MVSILAGTYQHRGRSVEKICLDVFVAECSIWGGEKYFTEKNRSIVSIPDMAGYEGGL